MPPSLSIALHDVSPLTLNASRELASLVDAISGATAPLTLLVIPHHHRRKRIDAAGEFRSWIDSRLARGDELALHGLWHIDEASAPRRIDEWWRRRVMTDSEAEFSVLDANAARMRIEHGLALFAACGWRAAGFVPPAWQVSAATLQVLREFELRYVTTRTAIVDLPGNSSRRAAALSLSARAPLRRYLSRHWSEHWLRAHRDDAAYRLALHPADAEFGAMRDIWRRCLHDLLGRARPMTKSRLLGG